MAAAEPIDAVGDVGDGPETPTTVLSAATADMPALAVFAVRPAGLELNGMPPSAARPRPRPDARSIRRAARRLVDRPAVERFGHLLDADGCGPEMPEAGRDTFPHTCAGGPDRESDPRRPIGPYSPPGRRGVLDADATGATGPGHGPGCRRPWGHAPRAVARKAVGVVPVRCRKNLVKSLASAKPRRAATAATVNGPWASSLLASSTTRSSM